MGLAATYSIKKFSKSRIAEKYKNFILS
jgi:hypothetical protein